jgi:hypothetical protein
MCIKIHSFGFEQFFLRSWSVTIPVLIIKNGLFLKKKIFCINFLLYLRRDIIITYVNTHIFKLSEDYFLTAGSCFAYSSKQEEEGEGLELVLIIARQSNHFCFLLFYLSSERVLILY